MYIVPFFGKSDSKGNYQLVDKRKWLKVTSFFGEILYKIQILFRYVAWARFNLQREFKASLDILSSLLVLDFTNYFFKSKYVEKLLKKGLVRNFEQLTESGLL